MSGARTRRRHRRRARARRNIYGTKPQFMPRTLAVKKYANLGTRTIYFKRSGTINSNAAGVTSFVWRTYAGDDTATNPIRMPEIADSPVAAMMYTEYKVLAIRVRLYAANVGTETGQLAGGGTPNVPGFNRGNAITYLDQDIQKDEPVYSDITQVMNTGSARMIPPRVSSFSRVIYRKKGEPSWGCCDRNVDVDDRTPDPWQAGILLLGDNATTAINAGIRPLWFYTCTYKIIFRGRNFVP